MCREKELEEVYEQTKRRKKQEKEDLKRMEIKKKVSGLLF